MNLSVNSNQSPRRRYCARSFAPKKQGGKSNPFSLRKPTIACTRVPYSNSKLFTCNFWLAAPSTKQTDSHDVRLAGPIALQVRLNYALQLLELRQVCPQILSYLIATLKGVGEPVDRARETQRECFQVHSSQRAPKCCASARHGQFPMEEAPTTPWPTLTHRTRHRASS